MSSQPGDLTSDLLARPGAAAVAGVAAFMAYGAATVWTNGWSLTLGQHFLSREHGIWLTAWMLLGGAGAVLLAPSLAIFAARGFGERVAGWWSTGSDAAWCAAAMVLAFVLPVLFRAVVTMNMPLVTDETTYLFSAQILSMGHLTVPSPPLKLFFDAGLVVNDGRMYTQYFLGWPALLAPFVLLGIPGLANAVYAALTVPAVFLVARRLAGSAWARVSLVLFLTSPMLMIGASNEMSHTTTFGALAWLLWAALRARDPDAPAWTHALVGLCFAGGFFIRPTSTVGTGLPVLLYWAWGWWSLPAARKPAAALLFLAPTVTLGAAFLAVNLVQNGSVTEVAYFAHIQYMGQNENRFAGLDISEDETFPINSFDPLVMLKVGAIAAIRLDGGLFGWPVSLLFTPFARGPGVRLLWAMVATHFALHMPLLDVGVETYGPMHYFETSLPLLLLSVLGLRAFTARTAADPEPRRSTPYALLATLVAASLAGYWPVHAHALHGAATTVARPMHLVAPLEEAVVFAPWPFAARCPQDVTWNYMLWRPNIDPRFEDDVLWVNHITLAADRKLMREVFPDRRGWVLVFDEPCAWSLVDLSDPAASVEDADIGGSHRLDPEYLDP